MAEARRTPVPKATGPACVVCLLEGTPRGLGGVARGAGLYTIVCGAQGLLHGTQGLLRRGIGKVA